MLTWLMVAFSFFPVRGYLPCTTMRPADGRDIRLPMEHLELNGLVQRRSTYRALVVHLTSNAPPRPDQLGMAPQPPPTDAPLTALLNEIATLSDRFVLVLDDYHVI